MKKISLNTGNYVARIREILQSARHQSLRAVNSTMVAAYWYIGREIVEEEQRGKKRADYGRAARSQVKLGQSLRSQFHFMSYKPISYN